MNQLLTQRLACQALLRQAREDKGLTIEEMSAISNFTKQVIRGIESDEYEDPSWSGASYVVISLYAKKLGVDETEVLETFDRWKAEQTGGSKISLTLYLKKPKNHQQVRVGCL